MNTYKITYVHTAQIGPATVEAESVSDKSQGWLTFYIDDTPSHFIKSSAVLAVEVERSTAGDDAGDGDDDGDTFMYHFRRRSAMVIRIDQPGNHPSPGMNPFLKYVREHGLHSPVELPKKSWYRHGDTGEWRNVYEVVVSS